VVGQLCAIGSLLLLAESLSAEQFGRLSFGLTVQGYAVLLGGAGIKTILLRDIARDESSLYALLTSYLVITASAGAIVCGVVAIGARMIPEASGDEAMMHTWLSIGGWFSAFSVAPFFDARGHQSASQKLIAVTEATTLLALLSGYIPPTLPCIAILFAGKWILASLLHLVLFARMVRPFQWRWEGRLTAHLLKAGMPLLLTGLVTTWPISGTVVVVRQLSGATETAIMGFAAQAATAYLLVAGVGYRLVQPRLTTVDDLFNRRQRAFVWQVAGVLAAIWFLTVIFTRLVITHWLPAHFHSGASTTAVLLLSSLLGGISYFGWACLLALKKELSILYSYLAGNLVFMALIWPAVLWGGHFGAAVVSCLALATTAIVMLARMQLNRTVRIDPDRTATGSADS